MGRFINCFNVVILKFKMATILDLIWPISPPAGRDSKMISKCMCSVCMRHVMFKIKLSQYPTTHTSYMLYHCTTLQLKS